MEIFVTPHARKRFKDRFRLRFNSSVFEDNRDVFIIREILRNSNQCDFALKQRQGNYNAICIRYGCKVDYFLSSSKRMVLVTTVQDNRRVVISICKYPFIVNGIEL